MYRNMSHIDLLDIFRRRREKKKQEKQAQLQERQQRQDIQRQKNPNGLLELAFQRGFRRQSFTAADPGQFYKGHNHDDNDPWKDVGKVGKRDATGFP